MNKAYWVQRWESVVILKKGSRFQEFQRMLLAFLSFFYGLAVRVRNKAYDAGIFSIKRMEVPVISIGNLSLGGTGKTSLTIWCAEKILKNGKKPVILSRGYMRRSSSNEIKICSGEISPLEDASSVGDEPCLIAQKCDGVPIIVGADRSKTAAIACKKFMPDCLLLDDGFQHRRLQRNLDIVCLDQRMWKAPALFPRGFLREGLDSLNRADFIVLKTGKEPDDFKESFSAYLPNRPRAAFSYRAVGLRENCGDGTLLPIEWLAGRRILSYSGIADPESFENLLERQGAKLYLSKRFSDHHSYTRDDLKMLSQTAENESCALVTTEKDAVKMPKDFPVTILCVELEWQNGERELEASLLKAIN